MGNRSIRMTASSSGSGMKKSHSIRTNNRPIAIIRRSCSDSSVTASQMDGVFRSDMLGQEGGGAVVAGLRYGEGILYTKNAGDLRVFWQGPSLGYDFGVAG